MIIKSNILKDNLVKNKIEFELPGTLSIIQNSKIWKENDQIYPVFNVDNYRPASKRSSQMNFLFMDGKTITDELKLILNQDKTIVLILRNPDEHSVMVHRKFIIDMVDLGITAPVILNRSYNDISNLDFQTLQNQCLKRFATSFHCSMHLCVYRYTRIQMYICRCRCRSRCK